MKLEDPEPDEILSALATVQDTHNALYALEEDTRTIPDIPERDAYIQLLVHGVVRGWIDEIDIVPEPPDVGIYYGLTPSGERAVKAYRRRLKTDK